MGTTYRTRLTTITAIAIILLILGPGSLNGLAIWKISPSTPEVPRVPIQAPPSQNATKVSITPSNITGTQYTSGQITFGVNITKISGTYDSLSSFEIIVSYDNTVLNALSPIDYSTGIFGQTPSFENLNCVNDQGKCVQTTSGPGTGTNEVTLALSGFPNPVSVTSGLLFNINFQIIGSGLSNIHIEEATVITSLSPQTPPSSLLNVVTYDGYFTNFVCGKKLCRPLAVSLNYTAVPAPVIGRPVNFNSTVVDPNANATIRWYHWLWGDTSVSGLTDMFTPVRNATHTYDNAAATYTTLVVNDTYGATGYVTLLLNIGRLWVQLSINLLAASPSSLVIPGTKVTVTAIAVNLGTTNETTHLSVILDLGERGNQTLIDQTCPLLMPTGTCSSSKILDTSTLKPNVYRLEATTLLDVTNSTLYMNSTATSSRSTFIWLVPPIGDAGLSVGEVSGLAIGIIVAAYAAFVFVGKLVRRKPEPAL